MQIFDINFFMQIGIFSSGIACGYFTRYILEDIVEIIEFKECCRCSCINTDPNLCENKK